MTNTGTPGLASALAAVQAELPPVTKNKTAKVKGETKDGRRFDYEYRYADLADVSAAIMPLLGRHGLAFTCQPTLRPDNQFGLAYQLIHESGELIDGWYPLDHRMSPQQTGGHITYARRYCLCAITGIAAEEDTDAAGAEAEAKAKPVSRGKPPERAAGNQPRNRDGSTSRSQVTDDELDATGQMTSQQLRDHNRLEKDTKAQPQTADRLPETPDDDPWYDPPTVRVPAPAPEKRGVIFAHFTRLARGSEPFTDQQRYDTMSTITGRQITSTNDLTAAEGIAVADELAKCRDRGQLIERLAVRAGEATDA